MASGEDELISRFFAPLAGPEGLGLLDDAALLTPPPGADLVLTKDALVAGVHFFADDPPDAIAAKALRVNLSDLAAKGARPLGFLLALALPKTCGNDWIGKFAAGLGRDARDFACPLFGGDTVSTPGPLTISITALGAAQSRGMIRRTGARVGDRLYVTGTIGDAAIGLALRQGRNFALKPDHRSFLLDRYLLPRPRNALAAAVGGWASGGMDVSDGFVGDLEKMLGASGVGGRIDIATAPLSPAASAAIASDPNLFDVALTGGDDYELLVSVAPDRAPRFEAAAAAAGVAVTWVGLVTDKVAGIVFVDGEGRERSFARRSYSHI